VVEGVAESEAAVRVASLLRGKLGPEQWDEVPFVFVGERRCPSVVGGGVLAPLCTPAHGSPGNGISSWILIGDGDTGIRRSGGRCSCGWLRPAWLLEMRVTGDLGRQ